MHNVFSFDPKAKKEEETKERVLEVLDYIRAEVEAGNVRELVAATMNEEGECQIHAAAFDYAGAVGLFEIGKHILITQQN